MKSQRILLYSSVLTWNLFVILLWSEGTLPWSVSGVLCAGITLWRTQYRTGFLISFTKKDTDQDVWSDELTSDEMNAFFVTVFWNSRFLAQ